MKWYLEKLNGGTALLPRLKTWVSEPNDFMSISITRNGKPLNNSLYVLDEKTKTLSTKENNLVINCNDGWTIKTGSECSIKTRYECSIKTGRNSTIKTGNDCSIKTESECTIETGNECLIKTGENKTLTKKK